MARFYVTGIRGQLGAALARRLPPEALSGGDLPELDVRDAAAVREAIEEARPEIVLHCAAMTDVDGCARNPSLAREVNAGGAANVAAAAAEAGAGLVYVGTNEVFDGEKDGPYVETDRAAPGNAYGRSKLDGEEIAARLQPRSWIVRTAWLYGEGGRNFVHRILEAADAGRALRVVTDEASSPTWTEDLAAAILHLAERAPHGVYHAAGLGGCSRFELARAALDLSGRAAVPIDPIASGDWPRASRPPRRTVLDCSKALSLGAPLRPWRDALAAFLRGRRRLLSPIFLAAVCAAFGAARAEQDPLEPPDLGRYVRWGPVRARPSLALTNVGYDDNVYQRTDASAVGDYTATASGRTDLLVLFGRRAFLTANGRLDYTAYARETSQNYWNRYGSGRLTVPFRRLGLYGDFAMNRYKERPSDRVDARTDVREDRIGGGLILDLGWRTDAEIGTVRASWAYEDPDVPSIGRSLDRTETGERALLRYRALGRTRLLLEAESLDIVFDSAEVGRNARLRRLLPGLDFGEGGRLSGTIQVGPGRLEPESPEAPDFSGTVGEAKLAYRLGSGTTLIAGGARDVRFAAYERDVYYLVRSYDLKAVHYFGRAWGVELGGARSRLDFPVTPDRVDRGGRLEAGVRLRMMENSLGRRVEYVLKVTHWRLESTQEYRDQSRTVLGFGAVVGY